MDWSGFCILVVVLSGLVRVLYTCVGTEWTGQDLYTCVGTELAGQDLVSTNKLIFTVNNNSLFK